MMSLAKRREALKAVAASTLEALQRGSFDLGDVSYDLSAKIQSSEERTRYYPPDSCLSAWSPSTNPPKQSDEPSLPTTRAPTSIIETSTLEGARYLVNECKSKIGVLNFASAKKVGGGFLTGAQAQEESIVRSSTLYRSLQTSTAQKFYTLHNRNPKGGYYSHAMIYSPEVLVFRGDDGEWREPFEIQVVTSPAVNAGVARRTLHGLVAGSAEDVMIEVAMRERMARILFLFEKQEVRDVVLGSFGTGVFRNNVATVATIWADLLAVEGARFKHSFDRVVFAILGNPTYTEFKDAFEKRVSSTGNT